jgi:superfamily I DNA/RNA helicase
MINSNRIERNMSLFTEDTQHTINQNEAFESHFRNFPYNEEQRMFIESPLEHSKLLGIPGGGKTQSILGKIFYHYIQGDFTNSKHYMILTFSRKTNIEFLHKCFFYFQENESLCNHYFHTKNIRTLQSLANRINKE